MKKNDELDKTSAVYKISVGITAVIAGALAALVISLVYKLITIIIG